jgi:radical SAM protein with 4Fe4S-binding SPASM domain
MNIEAYLMEKKTGKIIGLNELGVLVCEMYIENYDLEQIVDAYFYRQQIRRKRCKKEVQDFIKDLQKRGLNRNSIRIIKKESNKKQLLTVQLDLSWKCNLDCKYCYLTDTRLIAPSLSSQEWKDIIKQLQIMGVPKLSFLGGEPLLADNFFELAGYASSLGFKIYTTTNGTLVNGEVARSIREAGFNEIDVSLDGATPDVNDSLRGEGAFLKTISGIKDLVQAEVEVKTATVLNKANKHEVLELLNLGINLGVTQMYFNPLLPSSTDGDYWKEQSLNFAEWKVVKEEIENWNSIFPNIQAFAESGFDFESKKTNDYVDILSYSGCKAGKREMIITPDGYIAVCPMVSTDRRFQSMSVREYSLESIWEKDCWINKLREVDENNIQGKCTGCANLLECQGGCHIMSYLTYGHLNYPDPRCPH